MPQSTPVSSVIKDLEVTDVTVGELARDRGNSHKDLYAKVLMACEGDQVRFLEHLYDEQMVQDIDISVGWLALVKNGFFIQLLDPTSSQAQDLLRAVQFAIMITKDRIGATPHVCQRCKRTRR